MRMADEEHTFKPVSGHFRIFTTRIKTSPPQKKKKKKGEFVLIHISLTSVGLLSAAILVQPSPNTHRKLLFNTRQRLLPGTTCSF